MWWWKWFGELTHGSQDSEPREIANNCRGLGLWLDDLTVSRSIAVRNDSCEKMASQRQLPRDSVLDKAAPLWFPTRYGILPPPHLKYGLSSTPLLVWASVERWDAKQHSSYGNSWFHKFYLFLFRPIFLTYIFEEDHTTCPLSWILTSAGHI